MGENQAFRSVLEQPNLEDFIAKAELANEEFEVVRGSAKIIDTRPQVVGYASSGQIASATDTNIPVVPIPRRPEWRKDMTTTEIQEREGQAFVAWRRELARMEEDLGYTMTPYERNLEFWRQLWRCVEKSDVVVQIVDARDPQFYRSVDLERCVAEHGSKRCVVLINKADFVPAKLRAQWATYFVENKVDALFFSALHELNRQGRTKASTSSVDVRAEDAGNGETPESQTVPDVAVDEVNPNTSVIDAEAEGSLKESSGATSTHHDAWLEEHNDVLDCAQLLEELTARLPLVSDSAEEVRKGNVGFVGYPNVGKSSIINALFGSKKVSMSRTPGKTKHLQTLEIPATSITMFDCPGLVFPSIVTSRHHLVIKGTVPIVEVRDTLSPVRLIVEKVGLVTLLERYGCKDSMKDGIARTGDNCELDVARCFLTALCTARQHFLRLGVPDESWAARKLLNDFCTGELLHCEPPPSTVVSCESIVAPVCLEETPESDFSDLDDVINQPPPKPIKISKRTMRRMEKGKNVHVLG